MLSSKHKTSHFLLVFRFFSVFFSFYSCFHLLFLVKNNVFHCGIWTMYSFMRAPSVILKHRHHLMPIGIWFQNSCFSAGMCSCAWMYVCLRVLSFVFYLPPPSPVRAHAPPFRLCLPPHGMRSPLRFSFFFFFVLFIPCAKFDIFLP